MATTLDGFLTDEPRCLAQKLEDLLRLLRRRRGKAAEKAAVLKISWRDREGGSMRKIGEIVLSTFAPAAVGNLIDEVRDIVHDKCGQEPEGTLDVRGYQEGQASAPELSHQRVIRHDPRADAERASMFAVESAQRELADLRAHNRELVGDLRDTCAMLAAMIQKKDETIEHLATQRSVGTTAADAGSSIMSVVGLGVLVLAWPTLKETFGIPKDATMPESIQLIQARLKHGVKGIQQRPEAAGELPAPPAWRGSDDVDEDGEAEPVEVDTEAVDLVEELLERAEADPSAIGALMSDLQDRIRKDPDLTVRIAMANPWLVQVMQHIGSGDGPSED
jgi:hypothetical protein